jgi:hypothetical protein
MPAAVMLIVRPMILTTEKSFRLLKLRNAKIIFRNSIWVRFESQTNQYNANLLLC